MHLARVLSVHVRRERRGGGAEGRLERGSMLTNLIYSDNLADRTRGKSAVHLVQQGLPGKRDPDAAPRRR
jgi:hypothetical protein